MRKPAFCICENKGADQLRGNREADQRLCFRYTDSTIHLLPKSEISSLQPSSSLKFQVLGRRMLFFGDGPVYVRYRSGLKTRTLGLNTLGTV